MSRGRCVAVMAVTALLIAGCQREETTAAAPEPTKAPNTQQKDVICAEDSTIPPPPPTKPGTKRVTVIGDSYLNTPPVFFPDLIWKKLGEEGIHVTVSMGAEGGTGYTNCGAYERTIYKQRSAVLVSPDDALIVYIGGRNDRYTSPPVLALVAHDTYQQARSKAPNARLLVIGPIFPGEPPQVMSRVSHILKQQTESIGGTYIDPIAERWMSEPELVKEDGVHPSAAGNQYLAEKIAPLVRAQLQS